MDESFAASVAWSGFHLLPSLFVPNLLGQEVLGSYVGGGTQWEVAGYYAGLVPFALAMLALVRGEPQRRAERLAMGAMLVLAILLAPGLHSPVHRLAYHWLPLYAAMRCPARALYVFSLAVPLLAADGMDVLLARLGRRAWLDPATGPRLVRVLAVALPLVVAADLLWFQRAENPSLTLAEAHAQAFPPVAAFLRQHPGDRYVNDVHLDHALHNSGLLWGVENASGYSSIPLWRYLHFLWIANHGAPYPHARLHDDLAAQGLWRFSSPLVDALNVRWVIAPAHRPPDGPGFVRRFPDASNGPGGDDGAMVVYENLEALPRGWIVHRARVVGSEHAAALAVADPSLRPAEEVILEAEPSVAPRTGAGVVAGGDEIEDMTSMTPMTIEWGVRARTPGLLVASLPLHPGWHALVDGKAAPVLAADYALMAVAVPAGRHTVSLRYEAADVDRGLAVGAGAALVLLGAVLGAGIRERRTRRRNEAART